MSVFIKNELLTPEIKLRISTDLYIEPEEKSYANNYSLEEGIKFYIQNKLGIYVPYHYATVLLQKYLNHKIEYPNVVRKFIAQLYPNQEEVFVEGINSLKRFSVMNLNVPPGYGKTVLGARYFCELKLPAVVLIHRETLSDQWKKSFTDTVENIKLWVVGDKIVEDPDVIICMEQRYHHIPENLRKRVGLLIIDEAHCFCTESRVAPLLYFQPKYVISETATYERADKLHQMLNLLSGPNKVNRKIEKRFKVVKIRTGLHFNTKTNAQGKLDWSHLVNEMIINDKRNNVIKNIVLRNKENKILILTSRIDHVKRLKELLPDESIDTLCGNKKNYKDSRVLIGTLSKISTGFDEKNACLDFGGKRIDLVILATSIKDSALLEQSIGRGFRSDFPIIYDIVDENGVLKNHYYCRYQWYKDKNCDFEEFISTEEDYA